MKKRKYVPFCNIPVNKEFKYQGKLYLKTALTRAVSQELPVKHRDYWDFDFNCPVEEVNK